MSWILSLDSHWVPNLPAHNHLCCTQMKKSPDILKTFICTTVDIETHTHTHTHAHTHIYTHTHTHTYLLQSRCNNNVRYFSKLLKTHFFAMQIFRSHFGSFFCARITIYNTGLFQRTLRNLSKQLFYGKYQWMLLVI